MTEEQLQAACFQWHWNTFPKHRRKLFHIPNGGKRSQREAMKFKAMGVVAGVSDFIYLLDSWFYCIELKTDTGKQGINQNKFAFAVGYENYTIVRSLEEFKELILHIHEQHTEQNRSFPTISLQ